MTSSFKRPESVLVVVVTRTGKVLLLKRADHPDFWQSVTGAMRWEERDPRATAVRELREETGLAAEPAALRDLGLTQRYPILPQWRQRYAPEVTENTEHAFALELPEETRLMLHPEHTEYGWFPFEEAVQRVASWANRRAIDEVTRRLPAGGREIVVLVHGLWLKGWCTALLAWRLRRAGFEVHFFSYPTIRAGLRENAARLHAYLATLRANTVHLVGHSLGGVVIRALFQNFPPPRPGRIVMLAPPNQGSMAARQLARGRFGRSLLGKSVMELLAGMPSEWTMPAREVGIISGTRPLGLGRLATRLPLPNDGVLTVAETALPHASVQVALPVSHTGMLLSHTAAAAVVRFLRHGRFA